MQVNNRSGVSLIFEKALNQLKMSFVKIKLVGIPLIGFTRAFVLPLGMIDLSLSLGKAPHRATQMTI